MSGYFSADIVQGYLTDTFALAAVAAIGYLIGNRTSQKQPILSDPKLVSELSRASQIAMKLQQIALRIREDVASHQSCIDQFNTRVSALQSHEETDGWQDLSVEAETLLAPTMQLASKLSSAYDQLRKQSTQLMYFAGSRTDPVTGVRNRRAYEEQLESLLAMHEQNDSRFSLALFSVDVPKPSDSADSQEAELLCTVARLLENYARDTDLVARYSSDEFVVLMPQTSLAGAKEFSKRLLNQVVQEVESVVCGGAVEVSPGDTSEKLLSRADSALYSARAYGRSCLYVHNGSSVLAHETDASGTPQPPNGDPSADDQPVSPLSSADQPAPAS